MIREMTCITCPLGCHLTVTLENSDVVSVAGHNCKRGVDYAKAECTNPVRVVTTTVKVKDGQLPVVPVKTESSIPKGMIFDCLKALKEVEVVAPIKIGDVIVANVCNTGISLVATRMVAKK